MNQNGNQNQNGWSPEQYRLDVWQGQECSYSGRSISGTADIPEIGDTVVFFFAQKGGDEPGFYGWGIPWWDSQANQLADSIRGKQMAGTLWPIKEDLFKEFYYSVLCWLSAYGRSKTAKVA
jgi:hypothetical protein